MHAATPLPEFQELVFCVASLWRRARKAPRHAGHMQVFVLPSALRSTAPRGAVGSAVHQQASAVVVSTMPHENTAPHCEQELIYLPISFPPGR